ncbi:hypothetical protein [Prauserella cavernicola]|uniref:Uncharacterized protein n=1 Tax=Prauserella cavernicola TaxID=2800127 RepID=A0A934QPK7_9PSEU|nr:hypothetical protein [Prauserella cavernicola]MBK1783766.1 hypothetical protein [Prauserella cavernicola]
MGSGTKRRGQQAAEQLLFEKKFEKRLTWITMGLLIASPVLGIAAAALGAAEIYPSEHMMLVGMTAFLAPIGLSLTVGACAGLYLLGGPRAAPFGVLLSGGIAVLAYGLAEQDYLWRDVGVVLLMISVASFWAAPALFRRPNPRRRDAPGGTAGVGGVLGLGAAIAVTGYLVDVWWVLLFGALAVGTAAGAGIAHWAGTRAR